MEDGRVGTARDDRVVRHRVCPRQERRRLEINPDLELARPRIQMVLNRGERNARGRRGGAHPSKLDLVLPTAYAAEFKPRTLRKGLLAAHVVQWATEHRGRAASASGDPRLELVNRRPILVGVLGTGPQPFLVGDGQPEVGPAFARVEREHPPGTVQIGQVEVLGM